MFCAGFRTMLVVGSAHQQSGFARVRLRAVNIRRKMDAITHHDRISLLSLTAHTSRGKRQSARDFIGAV